jgi:uncharacterized membrane protein
MDSETQNKKTKRITIVGTSFSRWIVALCGVLAASGVMAAIATTQSYGQRITKVETQIEAVQHTIDKVDRRMERIESKLDELLKRGGK